MTTEGISSRRATVITAESAAAGPRLSLRTLQLNDVVEEARLTLESAREQAGRLLAEARATARIEIAAAREAELRKAREEGYRAGHEEGTRQGREAAEATALAEARRQFAEQHAHLASCCRGIIDAIDHDREEWLIRGRQDLIELALAIARRVVHRIGERDREVVLANLREALSLVGARTEVSIDVHPADVEAARVFAQSLLDLKDQWRNVRVVEKSDLAPGGCRVHWGSGAVDATLETQLNRIDEELSSQGASPGAAM